VKTSFKTGLLVAAISLGAPIAAHAQDEAAGPLPGTFTANVAFVNDYIFRGVTQSNHNAAVQGGMDWDTGMGFHFGAWASSVNFGDGNAATTELDLYGGYGGTIDNFSYDVGFIYYWYPGAPGALNYDLWEVYGKAGYDFGVAAVTLAVNYTPDNFGSTGDATYFSSLITFPMGEIGSISGGVGYFKLTQGIRDYTDWNIGATVHVGTWFDIDARYYNTDAHYLGRFADDRFVVKVSRAF
jgi:uncharacterized protein (TIGR02001 family)